MDKKEELEMEDLLMTHRDPWSKLTPRERSETEEMEIALKHLRFVTPFLLSLQP